MASFRYPKLRSDFPTSSNWDSSKPKIITAAVIVVTAVTVIVVTVTVIEIVIKADSWRGKIKQNS